jgi:hypothetical protein
MDKSALNYANLFGYQKALGLQGSQCRRHSPRYTRADETRLVAWRRLLRRLPGGSVPNGLPSRSIPSWSSSRRFMSDLGLGRSALDPSNQLWVCYGCASCARNDGSGSDAGLES